jgi:hypothetical protein
MPKFLLYAVIAVLGVLVLKSLVAPNVGQPVVVVPTSKEPDWWQKLIGTAADVYGKIWGDDEPASATPAPKASDPDGYMTPSWLV